MNEVARVIPAKAAALPVDAREITLSRSLEAILHDFAERGIAAFDAMPLKLVDEAVGAMWYYERATGNARRGSVEAWLKRLAQAVTKHPDKDEFTARLDSVMRVSGDTCVAAWTVETVTQFARVCAWWPSSAEIDKFIRPISEGFKRRRTALQMAIRSTVEPPAPSVAAGVGSVSSRRIG